MPLVRASAWWNGSMKGPGDNAVEIGYQVLMAILLDMTEIILIIFH